MNRKISWNSYVLDEIELVYKKAEENDNIGKLIEQLEIQALREAKDNVSMLKLRDNETVTSEQFDGLSNTSKETVIKVLGDAGLAELNTDMLTATIIIKLSYLITKVQACTIFSVLNRLEKLDGAVNNISPKWTLELQVPLGGKKGMGQWEMLIMQLYPWLSVRETSTNEMANHPFTQTVEKKSFWKKLFGK